MEEKIVTKAFWKGSPSKKIVILLDVGLGEMIISFSCSVLAIESWESKIILDSRGPNPLGNKS